MTGIQMPENERWRHYQRRMGFQESAECNVEGLLFILSPNVGYKRDAFIIWSPRKIPSPSFWRVKDHNFSNSKKSKRKGKYL